MCTDKTPLQCDSAQIVLDLWDRVSMGQNRYSMLG